MNWFTSEKMPGLLFASFLMLVGISGQAISNPSEMQQPIACKQDCETLAISLQQNFGKALGESPNNPDLVKKAKVMAENLTPEAQERFAKKYAGDSWLTELTPDARAHLISSFKAENVRLFSQEIVYSLGI